MTVMYFNPHPEQIARSRASTCGLATPKDPSDCNKRCGLYAGKPCGHYRPRVAAEPVIADPHRQALRAGLYERKYAA